MDEKEFMDRADDVAVASFDDQCTGANPKYTLIKELKQILIDTYYGGKAYKDPNLLEVKR